MENTKTKKSNMTKAQFNKIMEGVRSIELDMPDGITDEMAFDIAESILHNHDGLEAYIKKATGASDVTGWLMDEI